MVQIVGWLKIGLMVFDAVMAIVGVCVWSCMIRRLVFWPKVRARIVRFWRVSVGEEPRVQRFYFPVVRFETKEGEPVHAILRNALWRRYWAVGSCVSARYAPDNARRVVMTCFSDIRWIPLTAVSFGLGVLAAWWVSGYLS